MPSNLFGAGSRPPRHRSAAEVQADMDRNRQADLDKARAGKAAGRDSRSVGGSRDGDKR